MQVRIDLQPAFVLHSRPYRNTSLLLDILTPDYGRLALVAKGGRDPKKNQRHMLQPFIPLTLSWQGRGQLKTLTMVEVASDSYQLTGNCLYSAFYANELLSIILPQEDLFTCVFDLYQDLLYSLSDQRDLEISLRQFEFALLTELGYGITFDTEADTGEPIQADLDYVFFPDRGLVANVGQDVSSTEPTSLKGQHLLAMAEGRLENPEVKKTAKLIARAALQPHLRGRELKSRELFK